FGKKYFVLSSKQSTNLASINSTQLKAFPIGLPGFDEPKKYIGPIGLRKEKK
ncbi:MAG: restriction endonuclease subunit S, partial [Candidatus Electrothrix sp. ATG2]|nr:restriction endonuclease subunit S [Candidatus Electrothrix sp. ATG2]